MWSKPWKFAEGITIGAGLILVGLMLQFTIGPIDWRLLAYPFNTILLAIYVLVLGVLYAVRKHVYVIEWTMTVYAAVPAPSDHSAHVVTQLVVVDYERWSFFHFLKHPFLKDF